MADDALGRMQFSKEFEISAERLKEATKKSLQAARSARARARRERITMQSQSKLPAIKVSEKPPKLEMPEEWKGDEDTRKIKTGE